ncbi:MAG: prephenate dehydrogenase/arogenate dehydrogenase family protein, partial [Gemmatimonadetes bacterium]|nr:prephenate dehydrogenase/arogenate dehydrogenase family protein [Gemmatimonadota bacterium]
MNTPVLIVGFGRFGRALAGMLSTAGHPVYASDPAAHIPENLAAPQGLLAGEATVLLAVPVSAIEDAVGHWGPALDARHLVMDVCSVRSPAEGAMRDILGSRVPWVGTHPLFGPSSIALGERPLRVVLCPNELHPEAAERARALYESVGCEVLEENPEDHDRSMAYSHALAFFIAKAMLDMDAPGRTRFVPPSFQSMLRTIESVRSDAGHLFYAIEALNPFASGAREELLATLSRLHDELESARDQPPGAVGSFDIPDLGAAAPELRQARDLIDDLDRDIVRLVGRRQELVRRVKHTKDEKELPVRDPVRER